jgi:uncharacterized membrane protein
MDAGSVLIGVAAFTAAVAALFVAVTWLTRAVLGPRRWFETELGLEALEGRLARGEITRAEFDQAKRALGA